MSGAGRSGRWAVLWAGALRRAAIVEVVIACVVAARARLWAGAAGARLGRFSARLRRARGEE